VNLDYLVFPVTLVLVDLLVNLDFRVAPAILAILVLLVPLVLSVLPVLLAVLVRTVVAPLLLVVGVGRRPLHSARKLSV
jgi:hypothetical protein